MNTDTKQQIETALQDFSGADLRAASIGLLNTLGYQSEKTLDISSLAELREYLDPHEYLTEENALISRWVAVRFLFQLTNAEISGRMTGQLELIENTAYEAKEVKSYLFFAIEISGKKPTLTELSLITRSLNRLVPMPVFLLFKHDDALSLAIINRRRNCVTALGMC